MDPDANLKEQLELATAMAESDIDLGDGGRLAELALALDGWIKNGGFLPAAWRPRGPSAATND